MRICYLNHDLRADTGAGRFGSSLIGAIRRIRPDIEPVILVQAASGAAGEEAILPKSKWTLARALPRIRAKVRECDLIHALDGYPYGVFAMLAGWGLGKPMVITAIGSGALQPLRGIVSGWLLRRAYRSADRLVAVSNFTRRELIAEMGPLKVSVVNHGVDAEHFARPAVVSAEIAAEITKLRPYLLSVGALKPRKGFRYSIAAFAEVKRTYPNLRYVIIGSGAEERTLRSYAASLGVKPDIELLFLGNVPEAELIAYYQSAELFILLPVDDNRDVEGFGLVFLEAAAAGLPVIGAMGSGAEDAVTDRRNGILVPPGDATAAARAIEMILADSRLRARYAAVSRNLAKERGWDRAASAYIALYYSLVP